MEKKNIKSQIIPPPPYKFNCLKAFTLAEVLITLAIIGIVAALTIPTVISNYQHHQYIAGLKKAHATLSQVMMKARANGVDTSLDLNGDNYIDSSDNLDFILEETDITNFLKKNLKTVNKEIEGISLYNVDGSLHSEEFYDMNVNNHEKFLLTDGTFFSFKPMAVYASMSINIGNYKWYVFTDVNGPFKKPNKIGYDAFGFWISDTGNVIPMGAGESVDKKTSKTGIATFRFSGLCGKSSGSSSDSKFCITASALSGKNPDGTDYWKGIKYWDKSNKK